VGISSRGNDGEITLRDWHPVGAEEYGYVVADPMDPNIIYGGKISKYDKRTGQVQNIFPDPSGEMHYRFIRTAPIVFSPIDNKTLFFAGNVLFKTRDGGNSWQVISPDLTRPTYDIPKCIGTYSADSMKTMKRRGVIYTIALSPVDSNTIWCGTDDGYIQVTRDGGKTWNNVTPTAVTSWSKISLMDASHTDANTAYAAVNCIRLDDMHPHIYKTTDGGKTWKEIVKGLPDESINVVKEDPQRKGLLFAGSQTNVSVSFDDGEHWQSLRLNMPCSSIRDICIKDNDLIVATHGRSFWILDDITPLRQIEANFTHIVLYKPEPAYRVRWDMNTDTPFPADEPAGQNPPDGAIIDYYLPENEKGEVTLTIFDTAGNLVRRFSNYDVPYKMPDVNIPLYWVRPQQILSADSGSHRFLWDMHYAPLNVEPSFPISAVVGQTAPSPTSPWVMPGIYKVRLRVEGKEKIYEQEFSIRMDPRIEISQRALTEQFYLSSYCYNAVLKAQKSLAEIDYWRGRMSGGEKLSDSAAIAQHVNNIDEFISYNKVFHDMEGGFRGLMSQVEGVDAMPTTQCIQAVKAKLDEFNKAENGWQGIEAGMATPGH
jgi:hypothetical protein